MPSVWPYWTRSRGHEELASPLILHTDKGGHRPSLPCLMCSCSFTFVCWGFAKKKKKREISQASAGVCACSTSHAAIILPVWCRGTTVEPPRSSYWLEASFFGQLAESLTPWSIYFSESWPIEESKTGRKTKVLCVDQKLFARTW